MTTETDRTCPFCAELIKPAAKLCPRCRQWLTLRSFRNPVVALWVTGVPMLIVIVALGLAMQTAMNNIWNPGPSYTAFRNPLQVMESRMNFVATGNGLRIYVTGILTNHSPMAWKSIEFDCRFFNSDGALIDAAHPVGSLTIQPNGDSAFRAVVSPGRATNDYASHKLSVSTARNAKSLF